MTRPAIDPAQLRAAQQRRRDTASFIILLAGCYIVLSVIVGAVALANQLSKGF